MLLNVRLWSCCRLSPARSEQLRSRAWLSRSGVSACTETYGGDCNSEETLSAGRLAVIVVTTAINSKRLSCFRGVTRATSLEGAAHRFQGEVLHTRGSDLIAFACGEQNHSHRDASHMPGRVEFGTM